jgi:hypothetical protein
MPETGVELSDLTTPKTPFSKGGGAKCGALNDKNDSDLARVIQAWPLLSEQVKAEIKALIGKNKTENK